MVAYRNSRTRDIADQRNYLAPGGFARVLVYDVRDQIADDGAELRRGSNRSEESGIRSRNGALLPGEAKESDAKSFMASEPEDGKNGPVLIPVESGFNQRVSSLVRHQGLLGYWVCCSGGSDKCRKRYFVTRGIWMNPLKRPHGCLFCINKRKKSGGLGVFVTPQQREAAKARGDYRSIPVPQKAAG